MERNSAVTNATRNAQQVRFLGMGVLLVSVKRGCPARLHQILRAFSKADISSPLGERWSLVFINITGEVSCQAGGMEIAASRWGDALGSCRSRGISSFRDGQGTLANCHRIPPSPTLPRWVRGYSFHQRGKVGMGESAGYILNVTKSKYS